MSPLPRVLVIDDDLGGVSRRGEVLENPDREAFCKRTGLLDVTGDIPGEQIPAPVAEATFVSGLRLRDGEFESDIEGALAAVWRGWAQWPRWAMILLDIHFKTGQVKADGTPAGCAEDRDPRRYFGLTVLEHLGEDPALRDIPVIVLSAMERERIEERFSRSAAGFVDKGSINRNILQELLTEHGLLADDSIIGHSVALLTCLREARVRARRGNDNILLLGESGTGKELIANYIHRQSPHSTGLYTAVLVSAIPENLIEDELFGHERGAFTDGKAARLGAAKIANGGTLFLDEFADISPAVQTKLLRLLDKNIREVKPIGSDRGERVELQVVMATNRVHLLQGGGFRADLLARVGVSDPIVVPPLRERREDIQLLATFFLRKYEKEFAAEPREISAGAWKVLMEHDWPDNVRGIEQEIKRAVARWRGLRVLVPEHLRGMASPGGKVNHAPADGASASLPGPVSGPGQQQAPSQRPSLDGVLEALRHYSPEVSNQDEWKGRLDELQEAYALLLSRLLKAALLAKRDYKGQIQHTPAMRFLTGRKIAEKGEASIAYSLIKNLMSHHAPALQQILTDPVLRAIYETACEKRAGKNRKQPNNGSVSPQ